MSPYYHKHDDDDEVIGIFMRLTLVDFGCSISEIIESLNKLRRSFDTRFSFFALHYFRKYFAISMRRENFTTLSCLIRIINLFNKKAKIEREREREWKNFMHQKPNTNKWEYTSRSKNGKKMLLAKLFSLHNDPKWPIHQFVLDICSPMFGVKFSILHIV